MDGRQFFVANSIEQIAEAFPDHEFIASLECGSVINLPVKLAGMILGAVNLLDKPLHFTAQRIDEAMKIKPAAMIAFSSLPIGKDAQSERSADIRNSAMSVDFLSWIESCDCS